MRPRTLLILTAIVLGLGAFIWFYERELPSSEERAEQAKKVLSLEKGDVTAVTIESEKGRVRLERVEEGSDEAEAQWRITQPLAARADTFAVDRLLEAVASLERTRTLDEFEPRAVGLDKPRATVRLATQGGEAVLKLGAAVPTGGALIAGLEGRSEAFVVSDTILSELTKEPGEWRDRTIFRGDREAVQRITLEGANGRVVLTRKPNGFWIESPLRDRADKDLVDGLFSDLTGLTAERFLDQPGRPLAELGLAPPREVIEVTLKGSAAPVRIELGAQVTGEAVPEGQAAGETSYGRMAGGPVFEARTRLAESANRTPADWRALALSAFEVHQVESATVKDAQGPFNLTRAEPDWKRGDVTISYVPVSDLLFAVTGARAERLANAAEIKLGPPALTFLLKSKEAGEETITLHPPVTGGAGGVPARIGGRGVVLLLPANTLSEVRQKVADVRNAKPLGEEAEKEE